MDLGDLDGEMPRKPLDDATADSLLAGALDPEDAPPGYAQVAALVVAARGATGTTGLVGRDAAVSDIAAAIRNAPGVSFNPQRGRGRNMLTKLLTLKVLGVALPAMALTAGSAAAATGSLPGPAQSAVSSALSTVGIHIPSGHDTTTNTSSSLSSSSSRPSSNAVGPNASGSAQYGLCSAAGANGGHPNSNSVAFSNLQKAAAGKDETVTQYCAGVTPPANGSSNASNGANGSSNASNGANGSSNASNGANGSSSQSGSTPAGPPSSTPAPGTTPASTPSGPPSSTPAGKP